MEYLSNDFTGQEKCRSDIQFVRPSPVLARLIKKDFQVQSLNANGAVKSDEIVVPLAAILSQRGAFRAFHAGILQRWIHAPIGFPKFWTVQNPGKLILDGIKGRGQQTESFVSRTRRGSRLQSLKELMQSFRLRHHAMTLAKRIHSHPTGI